MISPVTSLVAAAASPAMPRPSRRGRLLHVRPHRRAVGQRHALPRAQQDERQHERDDDDDYPPIFADQVHSSLTMSIERCSGAEARPDRRASRPKRKPSSAAAAPSDDQRHAAAVRRPRTLPIHPVSRSMSRTSSRCWKSSAGPDRSTRRVSGSWCKCPLTCGISVEDEGRAGAPLDVPGQNGRRRRAGRATRPRGELLRPPRWRARGCAWRTA